MIVDFNRFAFLHELVFKPCEVKIASNDKGLKGGYLWFATSFTNTIRLLEGKRIVVAYNFIYVRILKTPKGNQLSV
jgi:hypothetical protein